MLSQQNIKISQKLKYIILLVLFISIHTASSKLIAQNKTFKVVLDAGHGGKDSGTPGLKSFKNSYERNVVLKVVKKLGSFLNAEKNIQTIYTRKKDKFVELHKRGKIANYAGADLFISIHCDAAANKAASGASTYVLGMGKTTKNLEVSKRENDVILLEKNSKKNYSSDRNSPEFLISLTIMQEQYLDKSIEFAGIVQNKFKTIAKRKDRGVHQGNLAVLYYTYMPSVLIEIGFLTNKDEERYLNTSLGQKKIAESIYKAILTYKKRLDDNSIMGNNTAVSSSYQGESSAAELPTKSVSKGGYYKIQFASSSKKIEPKPYNFKGLKAVERVKVGSVYKYFYGVTSDLDTAKKMRSDVLKKGYKDAFIAKFNFDKSSSGVYKLQYKEPTTKKVTDKKNTTSTLNYPDVTFKIQFVSSTKKIETKAYNFKGLKNVSRVKVGKYYKYYYGNTSNYTKIKKMRETVTKKGYKGAFIVALRNGEKVSVLDVLRGK